MLKMLLFDFFSLSSVKKLKLLEWKELFDFIYLTWYSYTDLRKIQVESVIEDWNVLMQKDT